MSLQNGNGDLVGEMTVMKENVDGMNGLWKDILRVVEWIIKENGDTVKGDDSNASSSMATKLEKRFKTANARIIELEEQLVESREENDILKEKLNAMELLAGHQQCELIRLTSEVEREKWERFDAENRLKSVGKDVAELHATLSDLIMNICEEEEESLPLAAITDGTVIKREIPDPDELLEEGMQIGEDEGRVEGLRCMLLELSSHVQQKMEKCKGMQSETKFELRSVQDELSNLKQILSSGGKIEKTPTGPPSSSLTLTKSSNASVIMRYGDANNGTQTVASTAAQESPSRIIPVPIKSILMKRSADGTFMIRRDSQDHQQQQQERRPTGAGKRKRVQFCLQDPDLLVITDHKENHRQSLPETLNNLPDPLEVDVEDEEFQQLPNEGEHHEIFKEGETINRFYCKCGRNFLRKKLLNRHLSAKLNGKIFSCPTCFKTFVLHESLKKHVQKTHKHQYQGGRYGCRECGQTFKLYRQLRQHRGIHQGRKQF